MIEPLGINVTLKENASNAFIIETLTKMLPFANRQMLPFRNNNEPKQNIVAAQNLPKALGIHYKADTWENQNIQLPSSLINTKVGDCKSFALLIAGFLATNQIENGLMFVGYKKGSNYPTHVYNYAIFNGVKYYIDGTLPANRIQQNRDKEEFQLEIMNVNVIAGPNDYESIGKRNKEKKGGFFKGAKKIALSGPRSAILALMALNVHGMATRAKKALDKNEGTVSKFWEKLGGNFSKFKKAIETGAKKKRILGTEEDAPVGIAIPALIASAAPILLALKNLFKGMNVPEEEGTNLEGIIPEGTEPLGNDFEVTDNDSGRSASKTPSTTTSTTSSFSPSPILVLALVGTGIYLATK